MFFMILSPSRKQYRDFPVTNIYPAVNGYTISNYDCNVSETYYEYVRNIKNFLRSRI
ncbi:hypothetical protein MXB_10, partial [Myxobolus squamalis]